MILGEVWLAFLRVALRELSGVMREAVYDEGTVGRVVPAAL